MAKITKMKKQFAMIRDIPVNGYENIHITNLFANNPDYREAYKSIGNGATFKRDLMNKGDVRTCVFFLCDKVAARLRKHNYECSALQVGIKDTNFHTIQRSSQLPSPTDLAYDLRNAVLSLIEANIDVEKEHIDFRKEFEEFKFLSGRVLLKCALFAWVASLSWQVRSLMYC